MSSPTALDACPLAHPVQTVLHYAFGFQRKVSGVFIRHRSDSECQQTASSPRGVNLTQKVGGPIPSPRPLLSLLPPLLPFPFPSPPLLYLPSLPLRSRPPHCGYGVWRSAQAPPAGLGRARPPNVFWRILGINLSLFECLRMKHLLYGKSHHLRKK